LSARIEQQREPELPSPILGDLHRQFAALRGPVETDGEEMDRRKNACQSTKSDQLPDAVRSPVATIEDEDDLVPAGGGEPDRLPVLVSELEVWGGLAC
ncbi:MAG: hypothetical protein QOC81_3288, partial [Thermoanaerobaculia bacterium]|nr:hypothetical protein [Thermoanaerobaculia bacterium]